MRLSPSLILPVLVGSLWLGAARAESPPPRPKKESPPARATQAGDVEQPKGVDTSDTPAPTPAPEFNVPVPAETVASEPEEARPKDLVYGGAFRARWISVPSWLLGLFTKNNVPLSSYHVGVETFRRKGDLDLVLGISYQNMSPPDGNWLGKGKEAEEDTDFIQFRNLGLLGLDVAFVWHKNFTPYFGIHYGTGIGVALVTGKILRTANSGCTDSNVADLSMCRPAGAPDDRSAWEAWLKGTESRGGKAVDAPGSPSRFKDDNVPLVIPIVQVLAGLDFRVPQAKGLEIRIEGGFFDAFFAGGALGYVF